MDYEKKYKALVEAVKTLKEANPSDEGIQNWVNDNMPELKESEDERIRKELLDFCKNRAENYPNDPKYKNISAWIAWLEKQGEQKPQGKTALEAAKEEKVDNQNCVKPADKVEPKFHEGEWIVYDKYDGNNIDKIVKFDNDKVSFESGEWLYIHQLNEDCKLWTIQDAKDGDVLCCESGWTCIFKALDNHTNTFSSYCFMDSDKWFCNTGSEGHTLDKAFIKAYNGEIYPATEEQCDLFFSKMKEAGYWWDADKKELRMIERKHTWSEEDEKCIRLSTDIIDSALRAGFCVQLDRDRCVDWLKSLRPQSQWKPSDEQMGVIEAVINNRSFQKRHLDSLYEQLKKLKGE